VRRQVVERRVPTQWRILAAGERTAAGGDRVPSDAGETEGFRIVLISLANGRTDGVPVGSYLASYDPEGADGTGLVQWTRDPAQAMTFATTEAASACYRAVPYNRPLRPDGRPNRPLTLFTVAFW
jgi:hypothetical protein